MAPLLKWPSGSIGRASDFGSEGLGFKSLGGRFFFNNKIDNNHPA